MPDLPLDFSAYPQPEWNTPESVPSALAHALQASSKSTSLSARNELLYALGNNHAGTYYPIVLAVMPHLSAIVRGGEPWPRWTVIEAMIDLVSSFMPESGHETFQGFPVTTALREHMITLRPCLITLAASDSIASKSAQDLLNCIE